MKYGLTDEVMSKILLSIKKVPQIDEAILYGSRAMGTFRDGSDIDLTLVGKGLSLKTQNNLAMILDDELLPYIFDISILDQISNKDLLDHIKRVGISIYKA